ncbi:VOC family protein [Nocardia brasiliensis]
MPIQMRAFMLGVRDLNRAKQFYTEGLGCEIDKDTRKFVALRLNDGALNLALYEWDAAAADAGVPAAGSGFRGASFHINPDSRAALDEIMRTAVAAGAGVVKDPGPAEWGGYYGYFSDPDGYLWKVTTAGS